jgi:flavin-binding protein dodecin
MATWTVSTTEKKSCQEREIWTKDGKTIVRINGFRWGTFIVETTDDNPPEGITEANEEGIDMYSHSGDNIDSINLDSMDDGWLGDYEFCGMDEESKQAISDAIAEADDYYEYLEEDGWLLDETEAWLYGLLDITKEENNA